jgi:hypothetical protein
VMGVIGNPVGVDVTTTIGRTRRPGALPRLMHWSASNGTAYLSSIHEAADW